MVKETIESFFLKKVAFYTDEHYLFSCRGDFLRGVFDARARNLSLPWTSVYRNVVGPLTKIAFENTSALREHNESWFGNSVEKVNGRQSFPGGVGLERFVSKENRGSFVFLWNFERGAFVVVGGDLNDATPFSLNPGQFVHRLYPADSELPSGVRAARVWLNNRVFGVAERLLPRSLCYSLEELCSVVEDLTGPALAPLPSFLRRRTRSRAGDHVYMSLLVRGVHRFLNEKLQDRFPVLKEDEPYKDKFQHVSQRPFWKPSILHYAGERLLPCVERELRNALIARRPRSAL